MIEKMESAARQERRELAANLRDFANGVGLQLDSRLQQFGYEPQITEVQEQHGSIQRVGYRPLCCEAFMQQLLKSLLSLRSDRIDGTHAAARHTLARYRLD